MPRPIAKKPLSFMGRWVYRIPAFIGGAGILYHEVKLTETSEPLLVLVALYLLGVPVVDLLNQLRQITEAAEGVSPTEPPSVDPTRRASDGGTPERDIP